MDEFNSLSPPAKVVLAGSLAAVIYLLISAALAAVRFVGGGVVSVFKRVFSSRPPRPASPTASTSSAPAAAPAPTPAKPGVSLKSLIKNSQKRREGGAAGPDHHADSELFVATLRGHTDAVTGLAFSADGASLATACEDRTLRVYAVGDPYAKALPFRHHALRKGVQDVAFGGAGKVAVLTQGSAGAGGLCMVDLSLKEPAVEWEQEAIFSGRAAPGLCLRGSASSGAVGGAPVLCAAAPAPELRLFSAAGGGAPLGRVDTGGMTNYSAAISRDGRFVAAATFTSDVKVYEIEYDRVGTFVGLKKAMDLKGHRSKVLALDFAPDGKRVVTASADGEPPACIARCGLPAARAPTPRPPPPRRAGTLIVFNIDVRYKQQEDPKKLLTAGLALPRGQCYSRLAWGPGGHIAAAHGATVHLLDARSGEQVEAIREAHSAEITDMEWSPAKMEGPQGRVAVLATAGRDGRVRLWRGPWLAV
jgi:WD40 repeat protein